MTKPTTLSSAQAQIPLQVNPLSSSRSLEAERLAAKLRLLSKVQRELLAIENMDTLCLRVVELGKECLGFERLGIWFFAGDEDKLIGFYGTDIEGKIRDERGWTDENRGLIYRDYFRSNDTALLFRGVNDTETSYPGNLSFVAPLRDGEKLIGILSCDNLLSSRPFDEGQSEILVLYATLIEPLCTRIKREESLHRNLLTERKLTQGLRNLYAVTRELSTVREERELCRLSVLRGHETLKLGRLSVWLYAEDKGRMIGTYGTDEAGQLRDETEAWWAVDPTQGKFKRLLDNKAALDIQFDAPLANHLQIQVGTGTQIAAPLWVGESLVGVLFTDTLHREDGFSALDQELISLFAASLTQMLLKLREEQKVYRLNTHLEERVNERTSQLNYELKLRREIEINLTLSEERLRLALQNGELGLWDITYHSVHFCFSPHFKALLGDEEGKTQESLESWDKRIHPEDRDQATASWAEHETGSLDLYEAEYRIRTKNGEWKWITARGRIVTRDADGKPVRSIGILIDIDSRKQLGEQLKTSEKRWKFALEGSRDGVWDWNIKANRSFFSLRWQRMLGYTPEDVPATFSDWLDLLHPEDRERVYEAQIAHIRGETPLYEAEFRMRCKDGTYKWILSRGKVMERDSAGTALRIVGTHTDIGHRKMMEEQLRESEERWKFALEGSGDGVWDWNIAINHVYFSRRWKEMLGYSADEVSDRPDVWVALVHPDDFPNVEAIGQSHMRGEIPEYLAEYRMRCKDGSYRWILSRGRVLDRAADGTPLRALGTHTDITKRKWAEDEILRLNRDLSSRATQLEAANKELESFSYSVSHDLRAPLRSIDGFSNALLEDYGDLFDPEARKYMDRISASTRRMGHLIDDLLTLSRITRAEVSRHEVDVTLLTEKVIAAIMEREENRQIEWVLEKGMTAYADPYLLRIVLENLLGNAVKFTGKNASAKIEIGVSQNEGETVYFVRDDGVGFDPAYAGKLFGAFQRLHRTTDFEGTGIGLATVQRIVAKHGGRIWGESEIGAGAVFSFTLKPPTRFVESD